MIVHDILPLNGPRLFIGGPAHGELVKVGSSLPRLNISFDLPFAAYDEPFDDVAASKPKYGTASYVRAGMVSSFNSVVLVYVFAPLNNAESAAKVLELVRTTRFASFFGVGD